MEEKIRNEVKGVEIDNQWCEEPESVRREAKKVFEQRFMATTDHSVRLGLVDFKSLPEAVSLKMVNAFSEEEVKAVVWLCEGSKSLGPNGFNFNFIKSNWEALKREFCLRHAVYKTLPKGASRGWKNWMSRLFHFMEANAPIKRWCLLPGATSFQRAIIESISSLEGVI